MAVASPRVSVVLPCLNEVDAVGAVVAEARDALRAARVDGEVIVVDNASSDGSGEAARAAGAHVVDAPRRGYGAA
ncbi:MAG TPA: glycosyltransferase, partial [Candidatus Limnocylindria bacterium]|nr:glycosyltransferase [Candidatus Limnocylindria bacterium]